VRSCPSLARLEDLRAAARRCGLSIEDWLTGLYWAVLSLCRVDDRFTAFLRTWR
jgi:hypothetical protein